jgi:hypothetical protein
MSLKQKHKAKIKIVVWLLVQFDEISQIVWALLSPDRRNEKTKQKFISFQNSRKYGTIRDSLHSKYVYSPERLM